MTRRSVVEGAKRFALGLVAAALVAGGAQVASAQLTYRSDQPVSSAYEGWEEDPDGTLYFLFGYMNSNWDETPDIPVGPDNYLVFRESASRVDRDPEAFDPGQADMGQPTHFLPRRNRFVFRVPVPDGFGEDDELIWSLTANERNIKAYATLRLDYKVEPLTKASEMGSLGAGTSSPAIRANKAPDLRVDGEATRTVRVGEPLTLVAYATDDGVPSATEPRCNTDLLPGEAAPSVPCGWAKPRQITVGSANGLRLSWYVYRGEDVVTFKPEQAKVWEDTRNHANSPWAPYWSPPEIPPDGRFEVQATFIEPGTYVLRCLASDGALNVDSDVTVTVTK